MTRTLDLAAVPVMELPPGWRRDQRWRHRRHAFLDPARTRFDPGDYRTGPVDDRDAKAFVEAHHYSRTYPSARLRHGLWSRATGELVGVAVLSVPMRAEVLTGVFPDLAPNQAAELGRLVLLDSVGGNACTYLVSRLFRAALAAGVRGVVSFSDPVARTDTAGRRIFVGHHGGVYQATAGALYLGRTRRRTKLILPDGTELGERGISKVRNDERGHSYVERRLERWGAAPRRPGESGDAFLTRALGAAGVRRFTHDGLYRYGWQLGATARQRAQVRVAMASQPYPKPDLDPVQLTLLLDLLTAQSQAAGGGADAA